MAETKVTPEVLWAQRSSNVDAEKNYVYLTINVPDVPKENIKLDLKPTGLSFEGRSDTLKKTYHVELEFYAEIDVDKSRTSHTSRAVELILQKKEISETYWPRLLKDAKRVHFLKTDFDKWVDEDEQDEAPEDDFGAGGPGGPGGLGGMGGMGGMGGLPGMGGGDFGGIDFSKLGGGAGMPTGDEDDDESDDDMPPLEGEEEPEKAAKADDGKEAVASS